MENLKSLADQLREELGKPGAKNKEKTTKTSAEKTVKPKQLQLEIIEAIKSFDNSDFKTMVHVRFDAKTTDLMNRFKLAAGVDVTRFVAFSVHHLFETHPEIKQVIKKYLQNLEL
jgi:hypothetical protein